MNRQQLELLDRTLARGVGAADRAALLKLALRELAPRHQRPAPPAHGEGRR